MIEQLLTLDIAPPLPTIPPVWLFDPTTGTDLVSGNASVSLLNGAIVNNVRPINGRNTINWVNNNSRAVVTLPTPLVLGTDWTVEWEANSASIPTGTDYYYEIIGDLVQANNYLYTAWGDAGFTYQLRMCCGPTDNQAYVWRAGPSRTTLSGPRQHAIVCRAGIAQYYFNGIRQGELTNWNNANNASSQITTPTFTQRATNPTISRFRLGAANDSLRAPPAGGFGRIRISDFARYSANYTPRDLSL